jgi:hypothetical protein
MFFNKKGSTAKQARSLLVIQAAQCAGLEQALRLLKRVKIISNLEERASFKCEKMFRPLDYYDVRLAEIVTFEHLDTNRALGNFNFWTDRFLARVEVSLERRIITTLSKRSDTGFEERTTLTRWVPVQASVFAHRKAAEGNHFLPWADESAWRIQGAELESSEDLPLKFDMPAY